MAARGDRAAACLSLVVVWSQSRVEALTGMRAYKQKLLFKGVLADAQVSRVVVGYYGRGPCSSGAM